MKILLKNPLMCWALWFCCICTGLWILADHDTRPGQSARASAQWPSSTALTRPRNTPVLLAFLHPLCPCSRASLAELARIRSVARTRLQVVGVIGLPQGLNPTDAQPMINSLRRIEGAQIFLDTDLTETHRFGCYTSGQALLYTAQGRLCYQGGMTGARGHEGDNAGKTALLAALELNLPGLASAPVYGCCMEKSKQ